MEWGNLRNWLGESPRTREFRELHASWDQTEAAWAASRLSAADASALALECVRGIIRQLERIPAVPVLVALHEAVEKLLRAEDIGALVADWPILESDASAAVGLREMLGRRRRWAVDFDRMYGAFCRILETTLIPFVNDLPEPCFGDWEEGSTFEVPLIELLDNPALTVDRLGLAIYDDDTFRLDLFKKARERFTTNMMVASGFAPDANVNDIADRLKRPPLQKGNSGAELSDLYLGGTAFEGLLDLPVPFEIPDETRFEHCHIVGGTGHGKTQLMQRMIYADLVAARDDGRSVVVIDSQGDLISKIVRLDLFDPDTAGSLANRLVLIDPADVEFPAALNLFDAKLARLAEYRAVDKERILNGVVELYETFFGDLLGAELTQKQGVIFRYLARLMLVIPDATIHTLMQLMEDGRPFKPYMQQLDGSARFFFEKEFFDPSFSATKKQILKRLWGVLSTPAFERMFAQKANKLDLFQAINDGKIVLVSTAKDLLKTEGSALFGRFFIALLKQAALERSTLPLDDRTPTFVYVDEAQEYFDESIETILNQARKYGLSLTLAHQALDQLSPRLRSVLASNTSMKCAGGVSAKDARALADDLHTSVEFIESMRRRGGRTEFAVSVKHLTSQAIRLSVPLGFLERQPIATEEAFEALLEANRSRYCGTNEEAQEALRSARETFVPDEPRPTDASEPVEPEPPIFDPTIARAASEHLEPTPVREIASAPRVPRQAPPAPDPGKGGSQHRYLQQLIKGLAVERGFRVVIEEAVPGGQVDVGLHRDDLSIACEVSVTSTPDYEAQNLAKCLRAGFARVWAIAPDQKRKRAIEARAKERLGDEAAKIEFLTTEDIVFLLDQLAQQEPEEAIVRGYRVKSTRRVVSPDEAATRRAAIARVLAQAPAKQP